MSSGSVRLSVALDGALTLAVDFYYPKVGAAACVARLGVRPTEEKEEEEDSVSHNVTPTNAFAKPPLRRGMRSPTLHNPRYARHFNSLAPLSSLCCGEDSL